MTPDQLALLQSSFHDVLPHADEVSADFYRRLFDDAPELRSLFPADLTALRRKFIDELTAIVASVGDLPGFLDRTRPLGQSHAGYGARPSHYRKVGDALLAALAADQGERWTPEVEEAWALAYRMVAETMQQAAR